MCSAKLRLNCPLGGASHLGSTRCDQGGAGAPGALLAERERQERPHSESSAGWRRFGAVLTRKGRHVGHGRALRGKEPLLARVPFWLLMAMLLVASVASTYVVDALGGPVLVRGLVFGLLCGLTGAVGGQRLRARGRDDEERTVDPPCSRCRT